MKRIALTRIWKLKWGIDIMTEHSEDIGMNVLNIIRLHERLTTLEKLSNGIKGFGIHKI